MKKHILASQIDDCSECPLYQNECPGGMISGSGGSPIEPPCTSWNDDTEVYSGMYDAEIDYSAQSLQWERERQEQKAREKARERRRREYEEAQHAVFGISKYGNAKRRPSAVSDGEDWFCPVCNRWINPGVESYSNGIASTCCHRCGTPLAYSDVLERRSDDDWFA